MNRDWTRRIAALRDLMELRKSVAAAATLLSTFNWDCDEELVTLRSTDVVRVLESVGNGTLSAAEAELWAESLMGRDDVALDPDKSSVLRQFLFEASTPELFGSITIQIATEWLERLRDI